MGSRIELSASDGHTFSAYRADPAGDARGGIVIVQEVFGVNDHVRGVCDGYAGDGYAVIAPAPKAKILPMAASCEPRSAGTIHSRTCKPPWRHCDPPARSPSSVTASVARSPGSAPRV